LSNEFSKKKETFLQENNNIMKVVSCTASELITYDFWYCGGYKISTKWIFRRKYRVSNSSSYCTGRRATEIEKWRRQYFYLVWASFMWLSL